MDLNSWDDPSSSPASPDRVALVEEFARLAEQHVIVSQKLDTLKDTLVASFPEDPGEFSQVVGSYVLTLKRPENWSWDTEKLADHYLSGALPDYVTKRLSIPKKAFLKLEESEREALLDALERKPGSPRLSVTRAENV